jgi:hypothetical protein
VSGVPVSGGWVEVRADPDKYQTQAGRPGKLLCRVHPASGMIEVEVCGRRYPICVIDYFPLHCRPSYASLAVSGEKV